MRRLLALASWVSCLSVSASLGGAFDPPPTGLATPQAGASTVLVLDNEQVQVFRVSTAAAIAHHPAAVVVPLEDGAARKAGEAYWSGDPAVGAEPGMGGHAWFIVIEPKAASSSPPAAAKPAASATAPGQGVFMGMSFKPLFENERVVVIRGRMDKGAEEGFHTHASSIVLVHLSGGAIEDTANGQTKVNHWKHGDVEFEARGSSHSARNLGPAVDAVLVTLKP
jgi:quercetin dioxygenase-like cupin family protein